MSLPLSTLPSHDPYFPRTERHSYFYALENIQVNVNLKKHGPIGPNELWTNFFQQREDDEHETRPPPWPPPKAHSMLIHHVIRVMTVSICDPKEAFEPLSVFSPI